MELFRRTIVALLMLGRILLSYLLQLGMQQLLSRDERDPNTGGDRVVMPGWLSRRRKSVDQANAKRLLAGFLKLRGVYVKLGQILSIMGGFLPKVYTKELEQLQDQVPPRPFSELEDTFLQDFGVPAAELYTRIESTCLAAASLGQVHEAFLPDGQRVAVKILYPGIRGIIKTDMRVLRLALYIYRQFIPVRGLEQVHGALEDLLDRETDYLHEAQMMSAMAANFERSKDILFPEVVEDLTTKNVLTMTFMEGLKINRIEEMPDAGIEPHAVAVRLVESFYEQLFVHRLFHADPHPGNFLVQAGRKPTRPKIVVLDFGAISVVHQEMVDGMVKILKGITGEDGALVLAGFYQMGFVSEEGNKALLEKTVMGYFKKLMNVTDRSAGALMRASNDELATLMDPEVARDELRELMTSTVYPEGWFYVERATVLLFWLVAQIDPDVDAMRIGLPYILPLLEEAQASR